MVILLALATVVSTATGGVVALRAKDRMHLVLGLAAGVMLGLIAFDLLPEVFALSDVHVAGVPLVSLALAAGFLVLHIVERAVAMHSAHEDEYGNHGTGHHHERVGTTSAVALIIHSFLDGVGIGLAFQAGEGVGIAVAIAVIAHDFADGLNTVTVMLTHRSSRRQAVVMLILDALAPILGAATTLVVTVGDDVLAPYLGFFAGFLLYLATSDILPEAHARHPSRLTLAATVAGVVLMWAVVGLTGLDG